MRCSIIKRAVKNNQILKKPWPESASEIYWTGDRLLSANFVPNFADRGCHVVSVTDPPRPYSWLYRPVLLHFFKVAPQLYSWGSVDLDPDPLILSKSCSTGNRSRTSGSAVRNSAHKTIEVYFLLHNIHKFSSHLTGSIKHLCYVARNPDH
jgi:hypothetical protein